MGAHWYYACLFLFGSSPLRWHTHPHPEERGWEHYVPFQRKVTKCLSVWCYNLRSYLLMSCSAATWIVLWDVTQHSLTYPFLNEKNGGRSLVWHPIMQLQVPLSKWPFKSRSADVLFNGYKVFRVVRRAPSKIDTYQLLQQAPISYLKDMLCICTLRNRVSTYFSNQFWPLFYLPRVLWWLIIAISSLIASLTR